MREIYILIEVAKENFNIINEFNLSILFIVMRGNVVNDFKEAKEICSQYDIPLYKTIVEFEQKNFNFLSVIKGDKLDDTVILFENFFII